MGLSRTDAADEHKNLQDRVAVETGLRVEREGVGCVSISRSIRTHSLIGLARVPGQLGPDLPPHRRQPPVDERRRLGHRPVLALEKRQHVKRIEDLRASRERPSVLRHPLGAHRDRHPVVIELHPHRPVGVADRHRVGDVVHPDVSELVGHPLAAALREVGRIERSLFMIDWTTDPGMRRRAQVGLNKGEAHHALKRAINFHPGPGVQRDAALGRCYASGRKKRERGPRRGWSRSRRVDSEWRPFQWNQPRRLAKPIIWSGVGQRSSTPNRLRTTTWRTWQHATCPKS